jgi:hypothetical protein
MTNHVAEIRKSSRRKLPAATANRPGNAAFHGRLSLGHAFSRMDCLTEKKKCPGQTLS